MYTYFFFKSSSPLCTQPQGCHAVGPTASSTGLYGSRAARGQEKPLLGAGNGIKQDFRCVCPSGSAAVSGGRSRLGCCPASLACAGCHEHHGGGGVAALLSPRDGVYRVCHLRITDLSFFSFLFWQSREHYSSKTRYESSRRAGFTFQRRCVTLVQLLPDAV